MSKTLIGTVHSPSIIQIGAGAVLKVGEVLSKLGLAYPLVVTDKTLIKLGHVKKLTDVLEQNKLSWSIFDGTVEDPTDQCLSAGLKVFSSSPFDCIIGFGGGSPMDVAKTISAMSVNTGSVKAYKAPRQIEKCGVPIILLPTTGGTGSEVTRWAVITDTKSNEKYNLSGAALVAKAAIIDWEFTLTKPSRLTADTAIDSLTHAIESYVSSKAFPFTETLSLSAMALIAKNVLIAFKDPYNAVAREALSLGASQAGLAFSNASVALVHGMSRPIGANFHISHGLSNAILLPAVTKFSVDHARERYARCALAMNWASERDTEVIACKKLIIELKRLNQRLKVPRARELISNPKHYFDKLSIMARQALQSGSPQNNPRIPTESEIIKLYEEIW